MTCEFSGYIARRLYRIAALEHENHKNNYALRVLPCSAANSTHSLHLKTHPSWVQTRQCLYQIALAFGFEKPGAKFWVHLCRSRKTVFYYTAYPEKLKLPIIQDLSRNIRVAIRKFINHSPTVLQDCDDMNTIVRDFRHARADYGWHQSA